MNLGPQRIRNHARTLALPFAIAVAFALLSVGPAEAGPGKHRGKHRGHHRVVKQKHGKQHHSRPSHHARKGYRDHRYADHRYAGHRYGGHGYGGHGYGVRSHGRFVVPTRIGHSHLPRLRTYYHGEVYHRHHRHHHDLYYFPVWTGYAYDYEPYFYCGGELLRGHLAYHGPRFSIGVRF